MALPHAYSSQNNLFIPGIQGRAGGNQLDEAIDTCDSNTVDAANGAQLYPILKELGNLTFFRLFRVNLKSPKCPFWQKATPPGDNSKEVDNTCSGLSPHTQDTSPVFSKSSFANSMTSIKAPSTIKAPSVCSVASDDVANESSHFASIDEHGNAGADVHADEDEDQDFDWSMTKKEVVEAQALEDAMARINSASCEFEEDLPTYWQDMCEPKGLEETHYEYVNLVKNPHRNTGYNGSHIWQAMYNENCFEVGQSLSRGRFGSTQMCYEERVLYRLLSGWQAAVAIAICKDFHPPGTKLKEVWAPNPERFMLSVGQHPERLKNLHFSFVVMLRAIKKATPFLRSYSYEMHSRHEARKTKALMQRLLDSNVLSLCSPLFDAFDETKLFHVQQSPQQRSALKRQFKSVFRNITVLVDCVQCQKCRLYAKLFSSGLGAALKVLLTPVELLSSSISQHEIVAIVNVLSKFSESIEDAKTLQAQYWTEQGNEVEIPQQSSLSKVIGHVPEKLSPPLSNHVEFERPAPSMHSKSHSLSVQHSPWFLRENARDLAIGAVKASKAAGHISADTELITLRYLMTNSISEQIELLSRHYAADQPQVFVQMAYEAAQAEQSSVSSPSTTYPSILTDMILIPDVVIVGGGLAGMVVAITVLDRGGTVVMLEKQPHLGGNSAKASSGINSALIMGDSVVESSIHSFLDDSVRHRAHLGVDPLIRKLTNDSALAVSWLQDRFGVTLTHRSQFAGHTEARTLRPAHGFIGAELTFHIGLLLSRITKEKPNNFRMLLRTKWTGLAQGSNGRGWRVSYEARAGKKETIEVQSVVIATGGFGNDAAEPKSLLRKHRPDLEGYPTSLGPWTTGDGVKIVQDLGAQLVDLDKVQLHPTGFVDPTKPLDHTKTLASEILRHVGGLLVDNTGRRFTNEVATRQALVDAMVKRTLEINASNVLNKGGEFALIINGKAAKLASHHVALYTKKGLLKQVSGLNAAEEFLGFPAGQLNLTMTEYNKGFQHGHDAFGRMLFPSPGPIENDEYFYVGRVTPAIHYTSGGIAIDADGHVLREGSGKPINGLWAVGEASGGVHGSSPLSGNTLLECTVFGRHVGQLIPVPSSTM